MDSRRFSRKLAIVGLIAGPLLMVLGTALSPAWDDDTAVYLQQVADNEGIYVVSGICWLVGGLILIPGVLGAGRLLRGQRLTLGQVAAGMVALGLTATVGWYAIGALDVAMVDPAADRAEMVALSERAEESAAAVPFMLLFFVGIVLGNVLLAVALLRRKVVPVWAPALLIASLVATFAGGSSRPVSAAGFALMAVAFAAVAMRIRAVSDEAWGHWEPLAAEPAPVHTAGNGASGDAAAPPAPAVRA